MQSFYDSSKVICGGDCMKKISIVAILALFISLTTFESRASAAFTDVNDRYQESVAHMVELGYTNGVSATQFGTNQSIKRIDAAVIVAKMMGYTNANDIPATTFSDVPKERAWAVNALYHEGVINGKTSTSFGSHDFMTRGEMAKVIASAYGLDASNTTIPFTDVHPRYVPYVAALSEYSIANGKTATSFGTSQNITRGEFSIFIYRGDSLTEIEPPEVEKVE